MFCYFNALLSCLLDVVNQVSTKRRFGQRASKGDETKSNTELWQEVNRSAEEESLLPRGGPFSVSWQSQDSEPSIVCLG